MSGRTRLLPYMDQPPSTVKVRPTCVTLISLIYFAASGILAAASIVGRFLPAYRGTAIAVISSLAPWSSELGHGSLGMTLAPILAAWEAAKAMGFWFLWRWARMLVLIDVYYYFGRGALAVALLFEFDRPLLTSILASPYFEINLVLRLGFWYYLSDPDVMRAFGIHAGQIW
jgi:hypothetical protein